MELYAHLEILPVSFCSRGQIDGLDAVSQVMDEMNNEEALADGIPTMLELMRRSTQRCVSIPSLCGESSSSTRILPPVAAGCGVFPTMNGVSGRQNQ